MTELRVDFNSVDAEGRLRARLSRFEDAPIEVGQTIGATDGEGNHCKASVVSIDQATGSVRLEIDPSTWWEETRISYDVDPTLGRVWKETLLISRPHAPTSEGLAAEARLTSNRQ